MLEKPEWSIFTFFQSLASSFPPDTSFPIKGKDLGYENWWTNPCQIASMTRGPVCGDVFNPFFSSSTTGQAPRFPTEISSTKAVLFGTTPPPT